MGTFLQDLRYGARMLLKRPGFTVIATLALALGIGANTAIFSVVNAVLLRPLPFPQPEQLVMVWHQTRGAGTPQRGVVAYPNFADMRSRTQTLAYVAAYTASGVTLTGRDEPEALRGTVVSADLFPALDVKPALGRVFTGEEDQPKGVPVIVLSNGVWQQRFGADPHIVGQQLMLSGRSTTVIGVMPPGFKFPLDAERTDYWLPLGSDLLAGSRMADRGNQFLRVVARVKPETSIAQAQAELSTIAGQLETQYPENNTKLGVRVVPLHEELVGRIRPALLVLLGAVGFVLLIACANVANLLLARAAARHKEMAIRTALGASRARVIRQLLTESVLLALLGGVLGLLLALWGVDLLVAASPAGLPRAQEIGLDLPVLCFTVGLSLLTGIVFGLAPALQASHSDLNESLKEGARGSSEGLRRNRVRSLLVVSEIALSLVLLVGAGLLLKSFMRLQQINPGFEAHNALTMSIGLPRAKYGEPTQQINFFHEALARARTLPGVEAAGAVNLIPLSGNNRVSSFAIAGRAAPLPGEEPAADTRVISPDYFRAMGIPLHAGRDFSERDKVDAPPVAIVNEAFVHRFFPDEDALSQRLLLDDDSKPLQIVGVVGNVRHAGLDTPVEPEYYVPYLQTPDRAMTLVLRTAPGNFAGLSAPLRAAIKGLDKDQYIPDAKPMEQLLSNSIAQRRFNMLLLGVFAGVALLLAAVGIYGVMAYSVTQRTHEIGIRLALGAQTRDVLKLVVGQGMLLALVGVGLGLLASFVVTRALASLLYDVSATDPLTFGGIALLLTLVALLACYIPARRATKVDPMLALRYE